MILAGQHKDVISDVCMNIYLLRHAEAESSYPDSQRILSAQGRGDAQRLGQFLRFEGVALSLQSYGVVRIAGRRRPRQLS